MYPFGGGPIEASRRITTTPATAASTAAVQETPAAGAATGASNASTLTTPPSASSSATTKSSGSRGKEMHVFTSPAGSGSNVEDLKKESSSQVEPEDVKYMQTDFMLYAAEAVEHGRLSADL